MQLFSALLPPPEVVRSIEAALGAGKGPGFRWAPPANWHITLGFFGEDDIPARAAWLRERVNGRPAVRVRLSGADTFPKVLWLGVESDGLAELANAAGAELDERPYRPHLTLARFPAGSEPEARAIVDALSAYSSPAWTAGEVVLMKSTAGAYSQVERFALDTGSGSRQPGW
ncbi:RNA 2',3'-cyclic phosphodiesterase [Amycolatopsis sp. YIM 10]|uniref:RNA 2',3'-cyclic phosphodiesterase n=1 Tax=Amycolatopsis sp. YIM 10 TaxID=2653857 RepID=UPI001290313A|nr:RNA 2',3'-cyclic phosphodiesterase [Amycolatopsis sp. YIM 10]QFU92343.1 2',5' RNA ligase family [Amycolatopsis sp. YIM 10]